MLCQHDVIIGESREETVHERDHILGVVSVDVGSDIIELYELISEINQ